MIFYGSLVVGTIQRVKPDINQTFVNSLARPLVGGFGASAYQGMALGAARDDSRGVAGRFVMEQAVRPGAIAQCK